MSYSEKFFHAYIISGSDEAACYTKARELAEAIVCTGSGHRPCGVCPGCRKALEGIHPDIIELSKAEGKRIITVDQIRGIRSDAFTLPNEAPEKVYIITDAGAMNTSAQNAFLKVLEEPPSYAHFIMTATNPGELLPTVRSRCRELLLSPVSGAAGDPLPGEDAAAFLSLLARGSRTELLAFSFEAEKMSGTEADRFFQDVKLAAAADLRGERRFTTEKAMRIIREADAALKYLSANVSVGHIMGHVLAAFI